MNGKSKHRKREHSFDSDDEFGSLSEKKNSKHSKKSSKKDSSGSDQKLDIEQEKHLLEISVNSQLKNENNPEILSLSSGERSANEVFGNSQFKDNHPELESLPSSEQSSSIGNISNTQFNDNSNPKSNFLSSIHSSQIQPQNSIENENLSKQGTNFGDDDQKFIISLKDQVRKQGDNQLTSDNEESYYSYSSSYDEENPNLTNSLQDNISNPNSNLNGLEETQTVSKIVYHVLQVPQTYNQPVLVQDVQTRDISLEDAKVHKEPSIHQTIPEETSTNLTLYLIIGLLSSIIIFILFRKQ